MLLHGNGAMVEGWEASGLLDDAPAVAGLVLLSGYCFPSAGADVAAISAPAIPVAGDILCHAVLPLAGRLIAPPLIRKLFALRPVNSGFLAGLQAGMALRPSQLRASAMDAAYMIPSTACLAVTT